MASEVNCPSCGTLVERPTGGPESCASCGHWWVPDADGAAGREGPHELEIQNAPGDAVRGPFDRLDLQARLYCGLLTGEELVRPVGGRFGTLQSLPDFAAILALRERGKAKATVTRRPVKEKQSVPTAGATGSAMGANPETSGNGSAASAAAPSNNPSALALPEAKRAGVVAAVTVLVAGGLLLAGLLLYSMTL